MTVGPCVITGISQPVVKTNPERTSMNALGAVTSHMERKNAVSRRRRHLLTPLVADRWLQELAATHLLGRYEQIPMFIRQGALAGIPPITQTFTPMNKQSTELLAYIFSEMIQSEFAKGRYIGPFSREDLESKIGPFQSSPLSLVPKSNKPGKFRLIQNLSFPHNNRPTPSINASLKSDDFPCTWGTFQTIATLIQGLPPGSQVAVRDISEAYRIIPLHESQWPGVVIRVSNEPALFALNTCNSFGCTTAGGLFGLFGDALADLLRAKGIGPILKWVDDFIFFRIPSKSMLVYNQQRAENQRIVAENGGTRQSGGRLWFKGKSSTEVGAEQFAEDLAFPLQHLEARTDNDSLFPYDFSDIDKSTVPLGIPWELSKDIPFSYIVPFIGFAWNLIEKTVSLPDPKKLKYLLAITEWRSRATHTLEDVQRLYGKLLYACLIVPRGRAYLTGFEKMMGALQPRPFVPRHPPKSINEDLDWWTNTLSSSSLSRIIPGGRQIIDVHGYSDASSAVGVGIVIDGRWRAWRLLPNWKTGGRDIGWAEAVAMEFLVRAILEGGTYQGIQVYGDNTGVVEGWWSGRSRNVETNRVFRRIHSLLDERRTVLKTKYVNTKNNPADGPSRGIFPPRNLLLPPIKIPDDLKSFIVNFDDPPHTSENSFIERIAPFPKDIISPYECARRQRANAGFEEAYADQPQVRLSSRCYPELHL